MPTTLYHVSDRPDISLFEPRPAPSASSGQRGEMVWAIDEQHLHNYLLPRDCPRVTFYATPQSTPEDVERLLAGTSARYVVAIESRWVSQLLSQRLYRYDFAPDSFVLADEAAGYYISGVAVQPLAVTAIDDILAELLRHDVELRMMPSLWKLRDAVLASSLQFSFIRMRNAQPREGSLTEE